MPEVWDDKQETLKEVHFMIYIISLIQFISLAFLFVAVIIILCGAILSAWNDTPLIWQIKELLKWTVRNF